MYPSTFRICPGSRFFFSVRIRFLPPVKTRPLIRFSSRLINSIRPCCRIGGRTRSLSSGPPCPVCDIKLIFFPYFFLSDIRLVRRRRRTHILSSGQSGLHHVLHVRRRTETSHAVPVEFGVQPERKRLRLAGKRRGLHATHAGPADVQTISVVESQIVKTHYYFLYIYINFFFFHL